jgi:hypothetical protein
VKDFERFYTNGVRSMSVIPVTAGSLNRKTVVLGKSKTLASNNKSKKGWSRK